MNVSLVIPGRNSEATVGHCLDAVMPLLENGELKEIVFVNDGSTDGTAELVGSYPVRLINTEPRGKAPARNAGWRAASGEIVWFIDSDCVARPDALSILLEHFEDPGVAGVAGSYDNLLPESLLACLVHEEIVERHRRMDAEVNYVATYNVAFRREMLERVDGLNDSFVEAEDTELSYRLIDAGGRLRIDRRSRVAHYHPTRLVPYLRTQRRYGYWRTLLYLHFPRRAGGDAYSGLSDHVQPPLAGLLIVLSPLVLFPLTRPLVLVVGALLVLAQLPGTIRLVRSARHLKYVWFLPFGTLRALFWGWGALGGFLAGLHKKTRDRLAR